MFICIHLIIRYNKINADDNNDRTNYFVIVILSPNIKKPHIMPQTTVIALFANAETNDILFMICCQTIA